MVRRRATRISAKLRRAPTRYDPIDQIASGGMAEVWRAIATLETGETYPVAIKRVLPSLANDQLFRSMFEDEARLGMLLRHPNLIRVYDARLVGGVYLMVMELVDGASLKALFDRAHARGAGMPVPTALHIVREVGHALAYAHSAADAGGEGLKIVHRDISPQNILLSKKGLVKLADFGLADARVHQTLRSADLVGGKLGYLAPEVIRQEPTDHRIDLFGVGVVLWEALAGRRLFATDDDRQTLINVASMPIPPLSKLNRSVPADVEELVGHLLQRDPASRLASAHELIEEAQKLLTRHDPDANVRDVALLVGLHGAAASERSEPAAAELAREMAAFVDAVGEASYELEDQPAELTRAVVRPPRPS